VLSFDIVLATLGSRRSELERLLESLVAQSHRIFRLIVADQSPDDRLLSTLDGFRDQFEIVRVKSERGLSRARNAGLSELGSDVVTFADDDCWYPADLLGRVNDLLTVNQQWSGLSGQVTDEFGHPTGARWSTQAGPLDRSSVWTRGTSISIFLRREVVERVGGFDESLGLGSPTGWGSGEETDYLLRALEHGFAVYYEPTLTVFHHEVRADFTSETIADGRSYGMGMGRVLRKHHYPWWSAAYQVMRALGGALLTLGKGRPREARFHWAVARGRALGWLTSQVRS
jgi:glycosyltransferase involved in cell wall biosynthesis